MKNWASDEQVESNGSVFVPQTGTNNCETGEQTHNDPFKLISSEKEIHCFNPLIFTKFILDSSNNNTAT